MSVLEKNKVLVEKTLRLPVGRVFEALGEGKLFFNCSGDVTTFQHEFRPGGTYRVLFKGHGKQNAGKYLEIVPDKKVVFTWGDKGADAAIPFSTVTIQLTAEDPPGGVPEERTDEFVGWVREVLEHGAQFPERRLVAFEQMRVYFTAEMAARRETPTDDLISHLVHARMDDGTALTDPQILGNVTLLLLAGIDTTWSSIGSSLVHLAQNPIDQERLRTEPDLWPTAIEELLRAFAPVTMSRIATAPTEVAGCPVPHGRRVVISFPSANRDPEVFENPDEVRLDRDHNRHLAFGSGIHRCAGSNLARMELRVSLQTWIERVGPFALADADSVTWAGGQVRGPRSVPVTFAH